MVKIRVLPPMPILKDFHRNYRSALLMDNFKLIYRYDKERDEIIIFFIPYYILKGLYFIFHVLRFFLFHRFPITSAKVRRLFLSAKYPNLSCMKCHSECTK